MYKMKKNEINNLPELSKNYLRPRNAVRIVHSGYEQMAEIDDRLVAIAQRENVCESPDHYWDQRDMVREHLARLLNERTKIAGLERKSISDIAKKIGVIVVADQREEALEALIECVPTVDKDFTIHKLQTTPNGALIYFPFRYLKGLVANLGLMKKNFGVTETFYDMADVRALIERYNDYTRISCDEESPEHRSFWRKRFPGSFESGKRSR
jgi:hypothetical protein